ncbi:UNVERIFIED_CONTAM: hypothetical protein Slati_1344000 [Sesamum latifolium]|uniref:Gag-pol polyprotein n=1 Tax=Sesamum latifolium TaxID=2727402 RepID=A0AAW2XKJ4_9LAMI
MAVEEKGLLTCPRSWRDTPQRPKSDKFFCFHNDYGHTMEECRHLKYEIERRVLGEKLGARDPMKKERETKLRRLGRPGQGPLGRRLPSRAKIVDQRGTRHIPEGSNRGRGYGRYPLIQFGRAERSGTRTSHNDALVITAVLADYEVGIIFIDSGSSADILFGEAYDQMQLGDVSLEKVNTSLYGFAGEVVHPRGMISLPLTMEQEPPEILKRNLDEDHQGVPFSKKGKETVAEGALKEMEAPAKVQPTEELLNIKVIPGSLDKTT